MKVLLTGGTGYIASHTWLALHQLGISAILFDNFSNSDQKTLARLGGITGVTPEFVMGDVRDTQLLLSTIQTHQIDAVIHFAGLKAVGESVQQPLKYYANNVQGTISLLEAMDIAGVKKLIFSSSATVYGAPTYLPLDENHPRSATNPYGRSKLHIEEMLEDHTLANPDWHVMFLRYFNPVGAHESGLIGELPSGIPNNLMPYVMQVAAGQREFLNVYGNDYPTDDGTGVRDYIHVMDLAEGHVAALQSMDTNPALKIYNLGTGRGHSVLELVNAFAKASGRDVPYRLVARRPGDVAACYSDPSKAEHELGWKARRDLFQMCMTSWIFQKGLMSS